MSTHPPFDKQAYERFRLARRFGVAISGIDDPLMVRAQEAVHMRGDDYVVGLEFQGVARAYPLWVIDNYHVVNDHINGERFFVTSCERCQSGAAFRAVVDGTPARQPLFRSVGFLNATLILKDLRSGSHWIHYEGIGLDRRAAGIRLPWIPTFHVEWDDWLELHPDTVVMVAPQDPTHPDARHGHGREEIFARRGMDPGCIGTIVGDLDVSYPENEMVLGLEEDWVAYPLNEVQGEGGVVHDVVATRPVSVFAGPQPDGFTMAAYESRAGGRDLAFVREDGGFRDVEIGSRWTIEGLAVEGPLAGERLEPVPWSYVRWHAWVYMHPGTRVFRSSRGPAPYVPGASPGTVPFDAVLSALAAAGHDIRIGRPLVSQRRPREAVESLTVYLDGDRVNLHACSSVGAARDLDGFDASWSGYPLRARSYEGRTLRVGHVVVESDPERRFVDPANLVTLPDSVIQWAKVLDSPVLRSLAGHTNNSSEAAEPGFQDLVRALRLVGFEVMDIGFLPPSQLRVGVVNGIALTIEAERFLLYRFETAEAARAYISSEDHARAFGRYVVRSTPDTMYEHQGYEVLYVGDDAVRWSQLLNDARLEGAFHQAAGEPK